MCAISGRFNLDGCPVSVAEMVSMRDAMIHRGPDDAGLLVRANIGLGHRRLSIIDLSGGHQPISNEDESVTIVFNGEIYNFKELRAGLLARGHTLRTNSDTEVIVHLYEDFGVDCLQKLRGMFAFALWDSTRQRLFMARDRLGEKPLYYSANGRSLVFASEIKAILRADGFSAQVDPVGLRRYLAYRHTYGNSTLFRGVKQLPPASYLLADQHGILVQPYWDVPARGDIARSALTNDDFLPLLEESVRMRMISDVPIGAFLSGGIDSSVVTALMARHAKTVSTFSIGFVPGQDNELSWARRVADAFNAQHHEFIQGSDDFYALLRKLIWHHDEPLTFPASIPLYLLSKHSKPIATVMLAGEGADELLAGYGNNVRSFWLERLTSFIPLAMRRAVAHLPLPGRLAAIAHRASQSPPELILAAFRLPGHSDIARACRLDLPGDEVDDNALLEEVGLPGRGGTFLDRLLYFQLKTYLIALLMKQDKMSMAASIETRVPFLDHHLVELAFLLPDASKVHGRVGKHLLRVASRGLLPRDIISRPKQGFPVPIAQWLRAPGNPFIEILLDRETAQDGILDPTYVRRRVENFQRGEKTSIELWAMLNLELWRRQFMAPPPAVAKGMSA